MLKSEVQADAKCSVISPYYICSQLSHAGDNWTDFGRTLDLSVEKMADNGLFMDQPNCGVE